MREIKVVVKDKKSFLLNVTTIPSKHKVIICPNCNKKRTKNVNDCFGNLYKYCDKCISKLMWYD